MVEILRSTDLVRLSWAEAVLRAAGVEPFLMDAHTSAVEGSISAIPRRLMVIDDDAETARQVLADADPHARPDEGGENRNG